MAENVVRAKQFELVDDYGNVYAVLGRDADTDSAALMIYDEDMKPRVGVGVNESRTGYVNLLGPGGGGVRVAVQENGTSVIRLRDEQGKDCCNIGYAPAGDEGAPNGTLNIAFADDSGQRVQMGVAPNGDSVLTLFDRQGREAASLTVEPEGTPALALSNGEAPFTGMYLKGPSDNIPAHIGFTGPDGEVRARILLGEDGTPILAFYDSEGEVVWGGVGEKRADEGS